ncbi:MAG: hypothetical protein E6J34_04900 [Chloroflexi bacterium]|nr:MAG: hypothetical protein E6J34_04900 [Chloroflexota bacterium]
MIYAIGLGTDRTLRYTISEAMKRGIEVNIIDLRAAVIGEWRLALPDDGGSFLTLAGKTCSLDPQASYFCRIVDLSMVQTDLELAARWRNLVVSLAAWLEHIPGTVVNRPDAHCSNAAKPLHEYVLQCQGFNVPASLTSSDSSCLAAFAGAGPTIVKTVSGVRANSRLVVGDEFNDFIAAQGPVHLQRYIAGADVRAHVVGEDVHAELIQSVAIDYRNPSKYEVVFSSCTLPDELQKKLVRTSRAFQLLLVGWDFKVTDDGVYWCLEANPMPGYDWYDRRLGYKITTSLLDLLTSGSISTIV